MISTLCNKTLSRSHGNQCKPKGSNRDCEDEELDYQLVNDVCVLHTIRDSDRLTTTCDTIHMRRYITIANKHILNSNSKIEADH